MYNNYYEMAEDLKVFAERVFNSLNGKVNKAIPAYKFVVNLDFGLTSTYDKEICGTFGYCERFNIVAINLDSIILYPIIKYFRSCKYTYCDYENIAKCKGLFNYKEMIVEVIIHELCHVDQITLVTGENSLKALELGNRLGVIKYIKENFDDLVEEFELDPEIFKKILNIIIHDTRFDYKTYKNIKRFKFHLISHLVVMFDSILYRIKADLLKYLILCIEFTDKNTSFITPLIEKDENNKLIHTIELSDLYELVYLIFRFRVNPKLKLSCELYLKDRSCSINIKGDSSEIPKELIVLCEKIKGGKENVQ